VRRYERNHSLLCIMNFVFVCVEVLWVGVGGGGGGCDDTRNRVSTL
jgi:hypothetical protein